MGRTLPPGACRLRHALLSLGTRLPRIFLGQSEDGAGFDVIIGNPPYDVLSEKESGAHVTRLKKFIAQDASLAPSRVGKNNLYKVFICRALALLL